MSVKIYNIIGIGFIMGEKIEQDNENIYLRYPGVLILNQQTPKGMQHLMVEPIPPFFAGKDEMLKRFVIKKKNVLFSGKPDIRAMELYQRYEEDLRRRISGIKLVNADVLKNLPKTGKGEPILQ
uniref:Uncharacterized protein n=1 Tax=viral metagenome TaxID=1070528 RepID=A0A6M3LKR7_9ZZZZ